MIQIIHLITFREPNSGKHWQESKNVEVKQNSSCSLTNTALVKEIIVFQKESK
jgi:hypothetical protein